MKITYTFDTSEIDVEGHYLGHHNKKLSCVYAQAEDMYSALSDFQNLANALFNDKVGDTLETYSDSAGKRIQVDMNNEEVQKFTYYIVDQINDMIAENNVNMELLS